MKVYSSNMSMFAYLKHSRSIGSTCLPKIVNNDSDVLCKYCLRNSHFVSGVKLKNTQTFSKWKSKLLTQEVRHCSHNVEH